MHMNIRKKDRLKGMLNAMFFRIVFFPYWGGSLRVRHCFEVPFVFHENYFRFCNVAESQSNPSYNPSPVVAQHA